MGSSSQPFTHVVGYRVDILLAAVEAGLAAFAPWDAPVLEMRLHNRVARGVEFEFCSRGVRPQKSAKVTPSQKTGFPASASPGHQGFCSPTVSPTAAFVTFGVNLDPFCGPR